MALRGLYIIWSAHLDTQLLIQQLRQEPQAAAVAVAAAAVAAAAADHSIR